MSEKFESLVGDLKTAFGVDFGEPKPQVSNLQEAVEISLTERQVPGQRPMPARGGFARGGELRGRDVPKPPKKKEGLRLKHRRPIQKQKREAEKRAAAAEKDWRGEVEAGARRNEGDVALRKVRDEIEKEIQDVAQGGHPDDAMMNISQVLKQLGARGSSEIVPHKKPDRKPEPQRQQEPRRRPEHRAPERAVQSGGGVSPQKRPGSSGGGGGSKHNPFRNNQNLGLGPGTPPGHPKVVGQRHHDEVRCWSCKCPSGAYGGCECTGTGKEKSCPEGKVKMIHIDPKYHNDYNEMYHKWRAEHQPRSNRVTGAKHHMFRTAGAQ